MTPDPLGKSVFIWFIDKISLTRSVTFNPYSLPLLLSLSLSLSLSVVPLRSPSFPRLDRIAKFLARKKQSACREARVFHCKLNYRSLWGKAFLRSRRKEEGKKKATAFEELHAGNFKYFETEVEPANLPCRSLLTPTFFFAATYLLS